MRSNLTTFGLIVILTCVSYPYTDGGEIVFTDVSHCSENFTTDRSEYNRMFPIGKIRNESGIFLVFFIKGVDAHVIFSPDSRPKKPIEKAYEIVLGAYENMKSVIIEERFSLSEKIVHREGGITSDKEWRKFWITIRIDGQIQVGKGNETEFMRWTDPLPMSINHYGFSSHSDDLKIEWSLPCPQTNLQNITTKKQEGETSSKPPYIQTFVLNSNNLDSTSTQPPNQVTVEDQRKMNESLTVISQKISQEKKVQEILNQVDALIDVVTQNVTKIVNNLTIAVYVPNDITEIPNNTDVIWPYTEPNNTDKINITLPRGIVNYMKSNSLAFKMAIIKPQSHSSFDIKANNGRLLKQGPVIIVETNATDKISFDGLALEFKIDKNQLDAPEGKWNCRFWNNQTLDWEKHGITTMKDDEYITCTSDHLSTFSIVMDPYYGTKDDDEIFTVISVLGSLLTIPCLIITILLHCHKRARRKKISSKILINCCISLLLLHISFLIYTFFRQIARCRLLNFFVHYGVSSALLWTAADGINMWRILFVDIFDKRKSGFYCCSKIICWGFPIATSVVGVLITDYSKKEECGIYFEHNMLLYLVPCAMVMICNVIFFTIMFLNVVWKNKIKSLTGRKKKYVMSLVQVFGLFWCISFPLLWLAKTRLLGRIIFAVLVANQGVIIFIVRCMNEREIRCELLEYILCGKKSRRISTSTDDRFLATRSRRSRSRTEVTRISSRSSGGSGATSNHPREELRIEENRRRPKFSEKIQQLVNLYENQ